MALKGGRVEQTLLSAAVDLDFDFDLKSNGQVQLQDPDQLGPKQ